MSKYLIVRGTDGRVVNTIVWDGVAPYSPPANCQLIAYATAPKGATIGWKFINGVWESPPKPPRRPLVPKVVTMRQARLALLQADLLDDVEAAIAAADQATRIEWEYASTVERNNALVASLTAALGWTEAQVDELFIAAAKL